MSTSRHLDNLRRIFQHGVASVQPTELISNKNVIEKCCLDGREVLKVKNRAFNISEKKCHLVGFGKAVLGMAVQMERVLGDRLVSGVVSVPVGSAEKLPQHSVINIFEGAANNLPDAAAMHAARSIFKMAECMSQEDVLFVLISGGGSALLPMPKEPFTLESKLRLVRRLAASGASIDELNVVRIAISKSKGGGLASAARSAHAVVSLVISDIVDDPLDLIASGPTVARKCSGEDAKQVLEKYSIWDDLVDEEKACVLSEDAASLEHPENSEIFVIGSNKVAAEACHREATRLGYTPIILTTSLQGNVEKVAKMYKELLELIINFKNSKISEAEFKEKFNFPTNCCSELLTAMKRNPQTPLCLILGGETTVNVSGQGLGGRSQELALRMSLECHNHPSLSEALLLIAGTDGIDGPTPAAGAIASKQVVEEYLGTCGQRAIDEFIEDNDSFSFYKGLGGGKYHVITGHTGTNVMDLHLVIVP